jgi:hypothetical protein
MIVEQSVEWELAGETELLGENMPQCHFVHHKPTWLDLGSNPDQLRWEDSWLGAETRGTLLSLVGSSLYVFLNKLNDICREEIYSFSASANENFTDRTRTLRKALRIQI